MANCLMDFSSWDLCWNSQGRKVPQYQLADAELELISHNWHNLFLKAYERHDQQSYPRAVLTGKVSVHYSNQPISFFLQNIPTSGQRHHALPDCITRKRREMLYCPSQCLGTHSLSLYLQEFIESPHRLCLSLHLGRSISALWSLLQ